MAISLEQTTSGRVALLAALPSFFIDCDMAAGAGWTDLSDIEIEKAVIAIREAILTKLIPEGFCSANSGAELDMTHAQVDTLLAWLGDVGRLD